MMILWSITWTPSTITTSLSIAPGGVRKGFPIALDHFDTNNETKAAAATTIVETDDPS